jgi:hypothetical protein
MMNDENTEIYNEKQQEEVKTGRIKIISKKEDSALHI